MGRSESPSVAAAAAWRAVRAAGLAISLAALLAGLWLLSRPDPAPAPLPWAPERLRLGVNADLTTQTEADLASAFSRLAQQGLTTVRQRFDWSQIEPVAGQFTWDVYDRIVTAASSQDIELLAVLDGSPEWARAQADRANPLAPPVEREDFGRFAAQTAGRYAGRIRLYQVWDEPNIAPHWGARFVDPAAYAGLLREGYVQIKAADPQAVVLAASLAPTLETGGANLSDIAFLDQMLAAGAAGWFDAAAATAYGFDQTPDAPPGAGVLNYRRAELLHDVLLRRGLTETPLWATAAGWYAPPVGWNGPLAPWPAVSEQQQALYTAQALDQARRWPWLHGWLWAGRQPAQADDARWGFALNLPTGPERPVTAALTQAAAAANDILWPGRHHPTAPGLHYSGAWRPTPLAADPSRSPVDALTFRFAGRRLDLEVQRGDYWAYLVITVDGQPANALPRQENGEAFLALYDPLAARARITVADHLTPGEHQVSVRPVGGWGQWPLLALTIYDELPSPGLSRPFGWLLLIGGLLGSLAALSWSRRRALTVNPIVMVGLATTAAILLEWAAQLILFLIAFTLPLHSPELLTWLGLGFFILSRLILLVAGERFEIGDRRSGTWKARIRRFPVSGERFEIGDRRSGTWKARIRRFPVSGLWSPASGLRSLLSGLWSPVSSLQSPVSALRSPASGLRSLLSGLCSPPSSLDLPLLAFLAVALLSTLQAANFGVASREFRTVFLDAALFYFLVSRLLAGDGRATAIRSNEGEVHRRGLEPAFWLLLDGLALGAAVVALVGLGRAILGADIIRAEGVGRVRAFYGSPNNLALYLERVLPMLLTVAAFGAGRRRWIYGGLAALVLPCLILTFSRGALMLGLPAGLLVIGLLRRGRTLRLVSAGLGVGAASIILALATGAARFAGLFDFQAGTSFLRLKLWRGAWQMALDFPWLGVGPDNFLYAYRTRYVLPGAWEELNLSHPHNILLDFWTRLGLAGVAVGAWLLTGVARAGWRCYRALPDGNERAAVLGLLAGLGAALAHGLVDNSFFLMDLSFFFCLCAGLFSAPPQTEF